VDKKPRSFSEVFFRPFSCHAAESPRLESVAETQFFGIGEEILNMTRKDFRLCGQGVMIDGLGRYFWILPLRA
jgi:hypothetical protein